MSRRVRRALAALAVAMAAAGGLACDVNEYCVTCATDDAAAIDADVGPVDGRAGDAMPDACIPTGAEQCNGLDDDCDGAIDDAAEGVGQACGTDTGACVAGTFSCIDGELVCSGEPASPEQCNQLDDDCDGATDEGNPEGGSECGSDAGECIAGTLVCVNGALDCVGDVGTPGAVPEACDGRDNDCDGSFDEGVATGGACGDPDCTQGVMTCVGGAMQCVGAQVPTFELCDAIDQDCDGNPRNGYDLASDIRNCGACGTSCVGTIANATEVCAAGVCAIAACDPGWHDSPATPGSDCLYACDFAGPEACNGADDDCDGTVDEALGAPPAICDQDGACAGTVATCTATGWDCVYDGDASVDASGNLEAEAQCDGVDNDCDGDVDEAHPDVGLACTGGTDVGVCQDRGHRACDPGDPLGGTVCVIDDLGQPATTETCNALDDDCDGVVDDGASTGALQAWVDLGPIDIMQYEASRPDARAGTQGAQAGYACSRAGVQPWVNVTHPQAEAACAAIGARLCSEQEWHRACAQVSGTTWPRTGPGATGSIYLEAEDFFASATALSSDTGARHAWVPDYTIDGGFSYSGISAMRASPNLGADMATITEARANAPRLQYRINFAATGSHYVWLKLHNANAAEDDVWVEIEGIATTWNPITPGADTWVWMESPAFNVPATGPRTVTVYMGEDGVKLDALRITRDVNLATPSLTPVNTNGGDWSYASAPDTYAASTCNGEGNDSVPGGADDDTVMDAGAKPSCQPGSTGVFDLSGNVKEWTLERLPASNPQRGGSFNNVAEGITCGNSFSLANDSFFFNNVGFRCCRASP